MAKNIKVILGSVRTARAGRAIADWVMDHSAGRDSDFNYELIDLKDVNLPWYDEPAPPMMGAGYTHESTRKWSEIISASDGFVFITPEYNHGYSPVLKNAIDHLYKEWQDKPAAMVGYGGDGAPFSIEQLRQVLEFVGISPQEYQVGVKEIWEALDEEGRPKADYVSGDLDTLFSHLETALVSKREPAGSQS